MTLCEAKDFLKQHGSEPEVREWLRDCRERARLSQLAARGNSEIAG
jgi:hypothetical protein